MSLEALKQNTFSFIREYFDKAEEDETHILFVYEATETPIICEVDKWVSSNLVRFICPAIVTCPSKEVAKELAKELYFNIFHDKQMVSVVSKDEYICLETLIPTDKEEVLTPTLLGDILKTLIGGAMDIQTFMDEHLKKE